MFLRNSKRFHHILQRKMLEIDQKSYREAVNKLNEVQTNRDQLKQAVLNVNGTNTNNNSVRKLETVRKYLVRSGVSIDDLGKLSVLHVSGTKGKGSTCALCENLLRNHGYKTGFFSSPHLVEVRERIRINGVPISKRDFASSFWNVHEKLSEFKENDGDMPFYFQFLFIMSAHIFLREKVDVAVYEVGIGGEYDPTNVVTNVPVVGITSLGFDHTSVLGHTMESIAWNKAGIMKSGSHVFTVNQPVEALKVLRERSIEKKCTLTYVDENKDEQIFAQISRYPSSIRTNISLAVKLAEAWMALKPKHAYRKYVSIDADVLKNSIETCQWPGRYEIKYEKNIRYFLDGAHTLESMSLCLDWYSNMVKNRKEKRALMFNLTGGRCCASFFKLLSECQFETVLFVPNVATSVVDENAGEQLSNCYSYKEKWMEMTEHSRNKEDCVEVFPCVLEALEYLENKGEYNLLVTGSLHLIGAVSSLLDPSLNGTLQ